MIFKLLMIGHILGDFYFQPDKLVKEKRERLRMLVVHCLIYYAALFFAGMLFIEPSKWIKLALCLLVVSTLHGVMDWAKIKLENKGKELIKHKHIIFLADQVLHIFVLFIFSRIFQLEVTSDFILQNIVKVKSIEQWIRPALSVLICWKPSSVFVYIIFQTLPDTVKEAEADNDESDRIGSLIGILEREIILILGIMNQFAAIGFVLTAKSLARYKQLEDKAFAEKYLVGTLVSAVIAILCVMYCSF